MGFSLKNILEDIKKALQRVPFKEMN